MSYEVDYISWLERQKERLTFKYNKMKAENEKLREQFDYRNQSYMKLYEENEKIKEEVEHLNSVIQEEEDWKLLELEERWE